jgi:uncharacterized protein YqeY
MLTEQLTADMKSAMKSGDRERLGVIRMLLAELGNARLASAGELTREDEEKVLSGYAKKRLEAMDAYKRAGRSDLYEKERREHDITVSYLPPPLGEEDLVKVIHEKIEETGAAGMKDFGRVMKAVMASVGGRADGSAVSAAVKKVLTNGK